MPVPLVGNPERPITLARASMVVVASLNFIQGLSVIIATIVTSDSLPDLARTPAMLAHLDKLFAVGVCWCALALLMLLCRQQLGLLRIAGAIGGLIVALLNGAPGYALAMVSLRSEKPDLLQLGLLVLLTPALGAVLVFLLQSLLAFPKLRVQATEGYGDGGAASTTRVVPPRPRPKRIVGRKIGRSRFIPPGVTLPPPPQLPEPDEDDDFP